MVREWYQGADMQFVGLHLARTTQGNEARAIQYLNKRKAGRRGIHKATTTEHKVSEVTLVTLTNSLDDTILLKATVCGGKR